MKLEKGLISVIMTNYNTPEEYLREAIESVLQQTYEKFEFIIIDDCSTDNSCAVIESYTDPRIIIKKNESNIGLTKSLNRALKIANGEYIARMDSDDICEPKRFEKQIEFLRINKEILVCGTWANLFSICNGKKHITDTVCRIIPKKEIYRVMLLFGNYPNIVHSSAMFNHRLLLKYGITYNEKYIYAQDYRMWVECSKYADCAIVPEILFNFRVREGSISTGKREIQDDCAYRIMQEQLEQLEIRMDESTKEYHANYLSRRQSFDSKRYQWIKKIISANSVHKIYNQKILEYVLWKKWSEVVYFSLRKVSFKEKLKMLSTLPMRYYPELLKLGYVRKIKKGK